MDDYGSCIPWETGQRNAGVFQKPHQFGSEPRHRPAVALWHSDVPTQNHSSEGLGRPQQHTCAINAGMTVLTAT